MIAATHGLIFQKISMTGQGTLQLGKRIAVIGNSGSGKSTLAKAIAQRRGLTYIDSDALLWKPDWVERPRPEFHGLLKEAVAGDGWTLDGNLGSRNEIVLPRTDTVIWLDYSRHLQMARLFRRTVKRAWTGEVIFSGNRESWRLSFASRESILLYGWRTHHHYKRAYEQLFADSPVDHITWHRLTHPRQADALVRALGNPA